MTLPPWAHRWIGCVTVSSPVYLRHPHPSPHRQDLQANRHFNSWACQNSSEWQFIIRNVITVCARIHNFNFNGSRFTVTPVDTTSILSKERDRSCCVRAVVLDSFCVMFRWTFSLFLVLKLSFSEPCSYTCLFPLSHYSHITDDYLSKT